MTQLLTVALRALSAAGALFAAFAGGAVLSTGNPLGIPILLAGVLLMGGAIREQRRPKRDSPYPLSGCRVLQFYDWAQEDGPPS